MSAQSQAYPVSRFALWLAVAVGFLLTMLISGTAAAQTPDPDPGSIGGGALQFGLSELVKWAIPLLGAYLFSSFNKVQSAVADWPNALKGVAYTALTTALMYVGEFIHVQVSNDPANWTGTFWEGIAAGLVGTLLVRLGIGQARDPESATSGTRSAA